MNIEIVGIKFAAYAGGIIGGVASLAFIKNLTPFRGFMAVFGGAMCAGLATPVAAEYLNLSNSGENLAAFLLGVVGMNFVGGLFRLSSAFEQNPLKTVKDIKNIKDGKP